MSKHEFIMNISGEDFYKDCIELIRCPHHKKGEVLKALMDTYGIAMETVYHRIRTYFGKPYKKIRWEYFEPDRKEFAKKLLIAKDTNEMRELYWYIPKTQWIGIYDRLFGVSTFQKAKVKALQELKIKQYNPSIHDNEALFAAIIIGDGYVDKRRKSIKIEHGFKQGCWLKRKVELLTKAFPYMSKEVKFTKRKTWIWYSRKIPSKKYQELLLKSRSELIQYLNPFGTWILFLDDGHLHTGSTPSLGFSEMPDVLDALQEWFKQPENGEFNFHRYQPMSMSLQQEAEIQRFLNMYILPFEHLTPECMKYKLYLKR